MTSLALALALLLPLATQARPGASRPGAGRETPPRTGAAPAQGSGRAGESTLVRLRQLEASAVGGFVAERPWEAALRGVPGVELHLGHFERWRTPWDDLRDDLEHDLDELDRRQLPALGRARLDALLGFLRADRLLFDAGSPDRLDPLLYVERLEACVRSLVEEDGSLRDADAWADVLAQVPALWEHARGELASPLLELSVEAGARLEGLLALLRGAPGTAAGGAEAERLKVLAKRAAGATAEFREWLDSWPLHRGTTRGKLGREAWEQVVEGVVGRAHDSRELKARLLHELVEIELDPGPRPEVPSEPPDDELVVGRLRAGARRAVEVLAAAGRVEPQAGWESRFEPRVRQGGPTPEVLARLRTQPDGRHVLELETRGSGWPAELARGRAARLGEADLELLGARYGYPGEALRRDRGRTEGAPPWRSLSDESWGLYVVELLSRRSEGAEGSGRSERAELLSARTAALKREICRLLASIELHAEEKPFEEVAVGMARRLGLDPPNARHETVLVLHDPLLGTAWLGLDELLALERDLDRGSSDPGDPHDPHESGAARTARLMLANPHLRPADVRNHLIDRSGR